METDEVAAAESADTASAAVLEDVDIPREPSLEEEQDPRVVEHLRRMGLYAEDGELSLESPNAGGGDHETDTAAATAAAATETVDGSKGDPEGSGEGDEQPPAPHSDEPLEKRYQAAVSELGRKGRRAGELEKAIAESGFRLDPATGRLLPISSPTEDAPHADNRTGATPQEAAEVEEVEDPSDTDQIDTDDPDYNPYAGQVGEYGYPLDRFGEEVYTPDAFPDDPLAFENWRTQYAARHATNAMRAELDRRERARSEAEQARSRYQESLPQSNAFAATWARRTKSAPPELSEAIAPALIQETRRRLDIAVQGGYARAEDIYKPGVDQVALTTIYSAWQHNPDAPDDFVEFFLGKPAQQVVAEMPAPPVVRTGNGSGVRFADEAGAVRTRPPATEGGSTAQNGSGRDGRQEPQQPQRGEDGKFRGRVTETAVRVSDLLGLEPDEVAV